MPAFSVFPTASCAGVAKAAQGCQLSCMAYLHSMHSRPQPSSLRYRSRSSHIQISSCSTPSWYFLGAPTLRAPPLLAPMAVPYDSRGSSNIGESQVSHKAVIHSSSSSSPLPPPPPPPPPVPPPFLPSYPSASSAASGFIYHERSTASAVWACLRCGPDVSPLHN